MTGNPHWAFVLSAMLTPVIAILAAYIAYRQWSTGHYRLKFDLFEKRYKVYSDLKDFQRSVIGSGRVESDIYLTWLDGIREARWLFGERIFNYLHDEINTNALRLSNSHREMEGMPKGEERSKITKESDDITIELSKSMSRAESIFEPYLDISGVADSRNTYERWRTLFKIPPRN